MNRRALAAIAGVGAGVFLIVGVLQALSGAPAAVTMGGALLVLVAALGLAVLPGGPPPPPPPTLRPRATAPLAPPRFAVPPAPAPPPPAPPPGPGTREIRLPGATLPLDPAALDVRLLTAIQNLSPSDFEHFCQVLLEGMGYKDVIVRGKTGDAGIDLIMTHSDVLVIAQCKRYRSNVGAPAVRDFYGTLMHTRAAHGFFITTSDFTAAAREWAQGKPLDLISGARLVAAVRRYLLADLLQ